MNGTLNHLTEEEVYNSFGYNISPNVDILTAAAFTDYIALFSNLEQSMKELIQICQQSLQQIV